METRETPSKGQQVLTSVFSAYVPEKKEPKKQKSQRKLNPKDEPRAISQMRPDTHGVLSSLCCVRLSWDRVTPVYPRSRLS